MLVVCASSDRPAASARAHRPGATREVEPVTVSITVPNEPQEVYDFSKTSRQSQRSKYNALVAHGRERGTGWQELETAP